MDLVTLGLIIIALAWLVQLIISWRRGSKEIIKAFLILYVIGVLLLVISGYINSDTTGATFNLLTLVLAFLVWFTTLRKPRRTAAIKKKKR